MKIDQTHIHCDVCNTDLTDETGATVIGMAYNLSDIRSDKTKPAHKEYVRLVEVFGKENFNVCFVCWMKAMGIKPK